MFITSTSVLDSLVWSRGPALHPFSLIQYQEIERTEQTSVGPHSLWLPVGSDPWEASQGDQNGEWSLCWSPAPSLQSCWTACSADRWVSRVCNRPAWRPLQAWAVKAREVANLLIKSLLPDNFACSLLSLLIDPSEGLVHFFL